MNKFYFILAAAVLMAVSCQKENNEGGENPDVPTTTIPVGFDWKMTRDVAITAEVPVVDGASAAYGVIRVYSSPILTEENMVARGVAKAGAPFRTAVTMPAGAENVYVQTTLPDGTKAVKMFGARETVHASGAVMESAKPRLRIAQEGLLASAMPACPELAERTEADMDPKAVIREIISGASYQLGANWAFYAAEEYYIPAGTEITGSIDLGGNHAPYRTPVLYVAGKLTLSKAQIGGATLAVLRGGEVNIGTLSTNAVEDNPAIYVFEGGKFTANAVSLTSKVVVNKGTIEISGKKGSLNANNSTLIYNAASGVFTFDEGEFTNQTKVYNDGEFSAVKAEFNENGAFDNYANGTMTVTDECSLTNNSVLLQEGLATFGVLKAEGGGTIYVNCYTVADEVKGEGAQINFGASAGLDAKEVKFNNTKVSMASASIFTMDEYNTDKEGGNNITGIAGEDQLPSVFVIKEKACSSQWWGTQFRQRIEVVYTNDPKGKYVIDEKSMTDGAVMRSEQTVVLPECRCNGGKEPVSPDPEPEPSEEFALVEGAPYSYCFEDNWPWFGDYDMNDIVVVTSVDRNISKDGSKVRSLVINWEPKAAGTTYKVAFAVQLDKIRTTEIASVASTHTGFGSGMFAAEGLEAGSEYAVIPFFNNTKEVLASSNTWPGQQTSTTKYMTTVEFAQPVDASAVVESAMNFFIAVKERSNEIHMSGYKPTHSGVVTGKGGCMLPSDPFKFYTASGDHMSDNYMMWALMIPGNFRYPAEGKDIRSVYTYFLPWASSNGTQHLEWYNEEADESKVYK